jgi:AraC-like DNA-binding protein
MIDYDLIVRLLTETLTVLEVDHEAARQRILQARRLALGTAQESPVTGGLADWQVRRVATFVHFNLSTKLRIEQVAQALKMSPSYLSRAFKVTTGITYSEFVLRARIDLAKWLLLTTEMAICDIALACGLADQSHLTRIFKKATGLPPRAWRRRLNGQTFALDGEASDEGQHDDGVANDRAGTSIGAGAQHARSGLIILPDAPGTLEIADPMHGGAVALWQERRTAPRRVGAWLDPHDSGRSATIEG